MQTNAVSKWKRLLKLNPELIGLPLSILALIITPVLIDYSGIDNLYYLINPDPSEQDRVLEWIEKLPVALIIPFLANFSAWAAVKFNRPDLWTYYKDSVHFTELRITQEWEALLYRYWCTYFIAVLFTGNISLLIA